MCPRPRLELCYRSGRVIHQSFIHVLSSPENCPQQSETMTLALLYVPSALRLSLMDSVHTSRGSGHPGSQRTLSLSPCHLPAGKLVPLPIPNRPCSHIGINFATDLPPSESYTYILVVVDQFSKACKLIPLTGLPTALETAESVFHHVFRHFGLPEDIVSDCGPQFISQVCNSFFQLLGISVTLSSGYHPQTNGQTERKIQEIGKYLPVNYWFQKSKRVWDSAHVHLHNLCSLCLSYYILFL